MNNHLPKTTALLSAFAVLLSITSCGDRMTYREALEAVAEAAISAKGESLTQEIIEISTDFTIGEAVENAVEELRAWLASQIDCSTVTVQDHTITVDFGTLEDNCVYNGHTYAGIWDVTIENNDADDVVVDHVWTGLTNGEVTLDGQAQVTWDSAGNSRRVVHAVTWSDDERTVEASGDRIQVLLDEDAGLSGGIQVDGDREWSGDNGEWFLEIEAVEMRGQDPVPQDGLYTLTTPELKVVTLAFTRIDDSTIECLLTAPNNAWTFEVSSTGSVEE